MPSVSFFEGAILSDGHAGYSDPIDEHCRYGQRLLLLIISQYAKVNFVDHQFTDQTSIIRFIEEDWNLAQIGNQSFDSKARSIANMFDFTSNRNLAHKLFLDSTTGMEIATILKNSIPPETAAGTI